MFVTTFSLFCFYCITILGSNAPPEKIKIQFFLIAFLWSYISVKIMRNRNFIWVVYIPHRVRGVATLIKDG